MIKNEYLTVSEISKLYNVSKRNIRRIINKIIDVTNNNLLGKDNNGIWRVHRMLLNRFKPQRVRKQSYYALTIAPCANYSESDIDVIMQFIADNVGSDNIEINYSVEQKKANNQKHVHCYITSGKKKKICWTGDGRVTKLQNRNAAKFLSCLHGFVWSNVDQG